MKRIGAAVDGLTKVELNSTENFYGMCKFYHVKTFCINLFTKS